MTLLFASENKDGTTSIPEYRIKHTHTILCHNRMKGAPAKLCGRPHIYIYCIVYSPIRMGKLYPACEICGIPYKKKSPKEGRSEREKEDEEKEEENPDSLPLYFDNFFLWLVLCFLV